MTNAEAIETLKKNYPDACFEQLRQACDMAIDALGAGNNVNSKDGDPISRQAAIDAVHKDYDTILDFKSDGRTVAGSFEDIINALPSAHPESCEDCVSRKAVIRLLHSGYHSKSMIEEVKELPSVQPEITDEQAIEHLQSTGWMQNHDKQMYEMGLKEKLADDSGAYDSLIPSAQPDVSDTNVGDIISRQMAIETALTYLVEYCGAAFDEDMQRMLKERLNSLPSEQPDRKTFTVIDTKTGKEADTYDIVWHEDWAKNLMYSEAEIFVIAQDGSLIIMDKVGNLSYCPEGRFEVTWND